MGRNRDLLRGSLEVVILSELCHEPRYGYQILTGLRERSVGRIDLKAGTLYPILHKLERVGAVRHWWEDSTGRERKWYAITDTGLQRLQRDARDWLDFADCVRNIIGPIVGGDAPRQMNGA